MSDAPVYLNLSYINIPPPFYFGGGGGGKRLLMTTCCESVL